MFGNPLVEPRKKNSRGILLNKKNKKNPDAHNQRRIEKLLLSRHLKTRIDEDHYDDYQDDVIFSKTKQVCSFSASVF